MPNSLKLLDYYILSNAPPKKRQWALNTALGLFARCQYSLRTQVTLMVLTNPWSSAFFIVLPEQTLFSIRSGPDEVISD